MWHEKIPAVVAPPSDQQNFSALLKTHTPFDFTPTPAPRLPRYNMSSRRQGKCPLSDACVKPIRDWPSRLLGHFESGACKAGMTTEKLNALVSELDIHINVAQERSGGVVPLQKHIASSDNHLIFPKSTAQNESGPAVKNAKIMAILKNQEQEISTCYDAASIESTSGSLLTGVRNSHITEGQGKTTRSICNHVDLPWAQDTAPPVVAAGSKVEDSVRRYTITELHELNNCQRRTAAPVPGVISSWACHLCDRAFTDEIDLRIHHESNTHVPMTFRCPNVHQYMPKNTNTAFEFKYLGGLAEHLAMKRCAGADDVLREIYNLVENEIERLGGGRLKLLE